MQKAVKESKRAHKIGCLKKVLIYICWMQNIELVKFSQWDLVGGFSKSDSVSWDYFGEVQLVKFS